MGNASSQAGQGVVNDKQGHTISKKSSHGDYQLTWQDSNTPCNEMRLGRRFDGIVCTRWWYGMCKHDRRVKLCILNSARLSSTRELEDALLQWESANPWNSVSWHTSGCLSHQAWVYVCSCAEGGLSLKPSAAERSLASNCPLVSNCHSGERWRGANVKESKNEKKKQRMKTSQVCGAPVHIVQTHRNKEREEVECINAWMHWCPGLPPCPAWKPTQCLLTRHERDYFVHRPLLHGRPVIGHVTCPSHLRCG